MLSTREGAIFENRYDAGRQLAKKLGEYQGQSTVVLAIPNGGVPVALEVALALKAELDLVISRKIPLPLNPEAGFGALADDGTAILNEELVQDLGLSSYQINYQINRVRVAISKRSLLYHRDMPPVAVSGKVAVVIDDGLASGFTMKAAVQSVRRRQPKQVVVAVPVASSSALERVKPVVDRVVTVAIGTKSRFAVADFYRHWYDISDNEVVRCLREWQIRRSRLDSEPTPKK